MNYRLRKGMAFNDVGIVSGKEKRLYYDYAFFSSDFRVVN